MICPDMVRAIVQFRTHIHGYRVIKATEVEDLEGILYHDGKYVAIVYFEVTIKCVTIVIVCAFLSCCVMHCNEMEAKVHVKKLEHCHEH